MRFGLHQGGPDRKVHCDFCPDKENLAVKTCLKCDVSLCYEHIKDHLERAVFSNHPLVKPQLETLKRKCPVHADEAARYCKETRSYGCNLCAAELNMTKKVSLMVQTQLAVGFWSWDPRLKR